MSQENIESLNNVHLDSSIAKTVGLGLYSSIPTGLEFLYAACRRIYPNQLNPLQVTAVVKYWLGGPDPLDYVSMYYNHGNAEKGIPPHWHYVSFGLSDLHGDGRVHEIAEPDQSSGFGFELTMRVRCEEGARTPATWPAALMQGLAKYIFQSDSVFCVGDHISWHNALDNSASRVQHMLIDDDPQLGVQTTPLGTVKFVQIVGITCEELEAAQHWNGCGILNIMKRLPETGGEWLITDMKRGESIFDLDPNVADEVDEGITEEGSNLSGVAARVSWTLYEAEGTRNEASEASEMQTDRFKHCSFGGGEAVSEAGKEEVHRTADIVNVDPEGYVVQSLPSLHLSINAEAGALLILALKGRLKHGRHFTFKSRVGVSAVTLLSPPVEGAIASAESPYTVKGPWLQVFIDEELLQEMIADLSSLANSDEITHPISYEWPHKKLKITVVSDEL